MANVPHKIHMSIGHQNLYLRTEVQCWSLAQVQQGAAMALMCNLGPSDPTQPFPWERAGRGAGWGRTDGRHVLLSSISCLFSSLQGLSLKGQNSPVSSGSSNTAYSYTNTGLQRDPSTVTPSSPRCPQPGLLFPELPFPPESKGCNLSVCAVPHLCTHLLWTASLPYLWGCLPYWRPVLQPGLDPFLCTRSQDYPEKGSKRVTILMGAGQAAVTSS